MSCSSKGGKEELTAGIVVQSNLIGGVVSPLVLIPHIFVIRTTDDGACENNRVRAAVILLPARPI